MLGNFSHTFSNSVVSILADSIYTIIVWARILCYYSSILFVVKSLLFLENTECLTIFPFFCQSSVQSRFHFPSCLYSHFSPNSVTTLPSVSPVFTFSLSWPKFTVALSIRRLSLLFSSPLNRQKNRALLWVENLMKSLFWRLIFFNHKIPHKNVSKKTNM